MVREAVVNALIHRDYAVKGAKCQLVVTENTIRVMSPGLPVEPITLEQMRSFDAPMLSRNPVLHYVFSRMELAEERGLGLKSLRAGAKDAGLSLPRFSWEPPYLSIADALPERRGLGVGTGSEATRQLTGDRKSVWDIVASHESITTRELIERTGFDERKVQRIVGGLRDAGLLRRRGTVAQPATKCRGACRGMDRLRKDRLWSRGRLPAVLG